MRRIAIINQKGGVGKTTTSVNLGAALAEQGRRVIVADLDPQANLSIHLGIDPEPDQPSTYTVLHGASTLEEALKPTRDPNLRVLPSNIDLSGAELELASAIGRDNLLSDALEAWERAHDQSRGTRPADYMIFDCPPSLGLLSINALVAAKEVIITVQTEFLALMGMSKLVEVVTLIQRRLNPGLKITGIAPCLYDSRLRLAREVLGEIRKYFPGQVFQQPIRSNVKLAEAPSFGASIIEYAPESNGALDYRRLALEVIAQEKNHPALADLPGPREIASLPTQRAGEPAPELGPSGEAPGSRALEEALAGGSLPPEKATPLPVVTLTPRAVPSRPLQGPSVAPKAPAPRPPLRRQRDAVEEELRIMRGQNLPPLPPEAFEIDR
jgi:chromosome partitioning protein